MDNTGVSKSELTNSKSGDRRERSWMTYNQARSLARVAVTVTLTLSPCTLSPFDILPGDLLTSGSAPRSPFVGHSTWGGLKVWPNPTTALSEAIAEPSQGGERACRVLMTAQHEMYENELVTFIVEAYSRMTARK